MTGPYAIAAQIYPALGWEGVLPMNGKKVAVKGYHGTGRPTPTAEQRKEWAEGWHGSLGVALRVPVGMVVLDIDHYDKYKEVDGETKLVRKRGGDDLKRLEAEFGTLPATWTCTARGSENGPGISHQRFYRAPDQKYAEGIGDIDILQNHHRYIATWPSINPETGTIYQWYTPEGKPSPYPPRLDQITAELPDEWVRMLSEGAAGHVPASAPATEAVKLEAAFLSDDRPLCLTFDNWLTDKLSELEDLGAGSRHDAYRNAIYMLVMMWADDGHHGGAEALDKLYTLWTETMIDRSDDEAESEWLRMVEGAFAKAVTAIGSTEQQRHTTGCDRYVDYTEMPAEHQQQVIEPPAQPKAPEPAPAQTQTAPQIGQLADDGLPVWDDSWDDGEEYDEDEEEVRLPAVQDEEGHYTPAAPVPHKGYLVRLLEHIGREPFEPASSSDMDIAVEAAKRLRPVLRRQSNGVWIEKGAEKWEEVDKDAPKRALANLSDLIAVPTKKADELTFEEKERLLARIKLKSHKGAADSAKMLNALSGGRGETLYVDADAVLGNPEHIWSAGRCIDIRRSLDKLVDARIGPDTINIQTTRYKADENCPTPVWDELVSRVWPEEGVREWALRVLAVAWTGESTAVFPILQGPGGSGKTSVAEILNWCLGDYGHNLEPKVLYSDSLHGTYLYSLRGKRMAYVDEGPKEDKTNLERLKSFTGGSGYQANAMYSDATVIRPTHTLVMSANYKPNLSDPALVRRVRIIPCNTPEALITPVRQQFGNLTNSKLMDSEGPGITAKMIKYAAQYYADPQSTTMAAAPETVQEYMREIQESSDLVGQFLDERMEQKDPTGQHRTKGSELYKAYYDWCIEERKMNPRFILKSNNFGEKLKEHLGPEYFKRDKRASWYYITLKQGVNF